jgi:hypothetical protein
MGRTRRCRSVSNRNPVLSPKTMKSEPSQSAIRYSPASKSMSPRAERRIDLPFSRDQHRGQAPRPARQRPHRQSKRGGLPCQKPKKPCHAFRMLYATRRHQHGVDIETLGRDLGIPISRHSNLPRSENTTSDRHRTRINVADRFSFVPTCRPSSSPSVRGEHSSPLAREKRIACIQ